MALLNHIQERFKITCDHCLASDEVVNAPKGELVSQIQEKGWVEVETNSGQHVLCDSCKSMFDRNPAEFAERYLDNG